MTKDEAESDEQTKVGWDRQTDRQKQGKDKQTYKVRKMTSEVRQTKTEKKPGWDRQEKKKMSR